MTNSPFGYPAFRWLLVARVLSSGGNWMKTVAAGWLLYQLSGQAIQVGILAAVAKGPSLIASPFGGWLSDRVDRRRLLIWLTVAELVPVALLTLLSLDGIISPLEIYVLIFLAALPHSLRSPVLAEIGPDLVPEPVRRSALSYSATAFNLARLTGPAVGGLLVASFSVAAAFAVNTVLMALVLVAVIKLPVTNPPAPADAKKGGLRRGVQATWQSLLLRMLLTGALTFFVFVGPIEQIMPVIAADHGDGPEYVGLLLAGIALGGLIGNPIVTWLHKRGLAAIRVLAVGLIASGALLILLSVSHTLWLDLVAVTLIGAAWEIIWLTESTTIHFNSPEGVSGEVMGFLYMVVSVAVAIGSMLAGWAFDTVGLEPALVVSGLVMVAIGLTHAVTGRRILVPE